jgi:cell division septation protein DedD
MISRYGSAFVLCLTAILLSSCANRQEEAARLEREMMSQDTAMSLAAKASDSQPSGEATSPIVASADAIPPSEVEVTSDGSQLQNDTNLAEISSTSAVDSVLALVASETFESEETQSTRAIISEMSSQLTTPQPMPRRQVAGKYTVQIAASVSESYASGLVDVYTRRGYEPFLDMKLVSGVTWYRVRIGHFETVAEAEHVRDELIDTYTLQAWVDNIPQ